jgi:hypothetical protein
MDSRERAILKTLLYSDFFDYPLKIEEIYKFLITDKKIEKTDFHKFLKNLKTKVKFEKGFYFLPGRGKIVTIRNNREKVSLPKMQKAQKLIKLLSLIPTVKFIGISGALSMRNSDKDDDIDIFVITKKGFVWITRLLMVIYLLLLGVYRNKNSKKYSDKICLNMLLDESHMKLEKDLYIAHEIAQLIPVFERDSTYKLFLQENEWVKKFMINVVMENKTHLKKKSGIIEYALVFVFNLFVFEKISKVLQLFYMKKHITKETVEDNVLRLHPFDYGAHILHAYNEKVKELGL